MRHNGQPSLRIVAPDYTSGRRVKPNVAGPEQFTRQQARYAPGGEAHREMLAELAAMVARGETMRRVGNEMGLTMRALRQTCAEHGIPLPQRAVKPKRVKFSPRPGRKRRARR